MKIIKGDLLGLALAGKFDVICHGANCFTTMGAGIAKAIRASFPEAYAADCKTVKGDKSKLGTISYAGIKRGDIYFVVVNAYTQFDYRGPGMKADYGAIKKAFLEVRRLFDGKRIAYPMLGAGLAGGDWTVISSVIDDILWDQDHTLVVLP